MDYGEMLAEHVNMRADFSVACMEVDIEKAASQFGVMTISESGRIIDFVEKPSSPAPLPGKKNKTLASMGIYVVSHRYLAERLREDAGRSGSSHDFGRDIIPEGLRRGDYFHAHIFQNPTNVDPP